MAILLTIVSLFLSVYNPVCNAQEVEVTGIKDTIATAIENLRASIPEPISVSSYGLDLEDNDYLTGQLNVSELKLTGLKGFEADLKYTLVVPKSFRISFDYIDLNLKYVSDLHLLNQQLLSIFGSGHILMALSNLTITGNVKLISLSPINVTIDSMELHLATAKFLFVGLLDNDDFSNSVSSYLNKNFANIFNQYSSLLAGLLEGAVNGVINGLLGGNSTEQLTYQSDLVDYGASIGEIIEAIIGEILSENR